MTNQHKFCDQHREELGVEFLWLGDIASLVQKKREEYVRQVIGKSLPGAGG